MQAVQTASQNAHISGKQSQMCLFCLIPSMFLWEDFDFEYAASVRVAILCPFSHEYMSKLQIQQSERII